MIRPNISADEFAALDPVLQAEYRREGDGYRANIANEGGWELANTNGLLTALSTERSRADEAERSLRDAQSGSVAPEEVERLRADSVRLQELTESGNIANADDIRRQLAAQHAEQMQGIQTQHQESIAERDARLSAMQSNMDDQFLEAAIRSGIKAVDPEASERFLLPELKPFGRVVRDADGGNPRVEVLDSQGQVRFATDESGRAVPADFTPVIEEFKNHPELGRAFSGGVASGSGATPQQGGMQVDGENCFDSTSPHFNVTKQGLLLKSNPKEAARLQALAPKPQRRGMFAE